MQDNISLLKKLQEFDLEAQEIKSHTDKMREALDELVALHEALNGSLEAQRRELEETGSLMRDKEFDLETNLERYNQSKAKLNHVSNTREYNALEREMDTLRKLRAQIEEERDSLKEAVEGFEADVAEKAEKTSALVAQIKAEEADIAKVTQKSRARVEELEKQRDQLKSRLDKPLVRRYEFISRRRAGAAVVPAIDGVCTGCNMRVPPQLYNELHSIALAAGSARNKLIQCPSCQRILHYQEVPDEAPAAEGP